MTLDVFYGSSSYTHVLDERGVLSRCSEAADMMHCWDCCDTLAAALALVTRLESDGWQVVVRPDADGAHLNVSTYTGLGFCPHLIDDEWGCPMTIVEVDYPPDSPA